MRIPIFIGAVALAGVALAQAPAKEAPRPAASVATEKASEVPDAEKIKRSSESLTRMRGLLRDVLTKLEEARNTKDVVKLNCVNEKLTQIKGLLRISEQADVSLQESVAKKEAAAAEHEYTKVGIATQKVEELRAEAEECIGQLAFRTDENLNVEVETPSNLPSDSVTNPPPPPVIVGRAPPASPVD